MKSQDIGRRGPVNTGSVQSQAPVKHASAVTASEEAVPDVYEKGGQLHFPQTATTISSQGKLERARRILEALRAKTENRKAFGGRVTIGGIDKAGSLGNYYPTLPAAGSLTRALPAAYPGIQRFIGQVSLPEDLTEWRDKGANLRPAIQPEKIAKLGEREFANWDAFKAAFGTGDPDALTLSDECLQDVIFNKDESTVLKADLSDWFGAKTEAALKPGWVRLYARAAELGIEATISKLQEACDVMPATVESAKVMARAARAFGKSPDDFKLGDKKLSEWHEEPPTIAPPDFAPAHGTPMGTRSFTPEAFWKAWAETDYKSLEVDDASLEAAWRNAYADDDARDKIHAFLDHPEDFRAAGFSVMARARELGLPVPVQSDWVGKYVPKSPSGTAALRRLHRACGWTERRWTKDGSLPEAARSRRTDGLGALGESDLTATKLEPAWKRGDKKLLDADDATVKALFEAVVWKPKAAVEQFGTGKVLELYARQTELSTATHHKNPVAYTCAKFFLEPLAAKFADADGIAGLARLARAMHIDFDRVKVSTDDGGVVPLSSHPLLEGTPLAQADRARADAVAKAIDSLDPSKPRKISTKMRAVEALIGKGKDEPHEVWELLPALLEARVQGQLQPIDISEVDPEKRAKFISNCLTPWAGFGPGELLFGLCVKSTPELLAGSMVDPAGSNPQWGEAVNRLCKLDGERLEMALAEATADPTELRTQSLALRTLLAAEDDPATLKAGLQSYFEGAAGKDWNRGADGTVPEARAILDRLAIEPAVSAVRELLIDTLQTQDAAGNLDARHVQAALHDAPATLRDELAAQAEAAIGDVVTQVLDTGPEERAQAMETLAEAIKHNACLMPEDQLAQSALERMYQADLTSVMPLAQAEASLGRVKGKDANLEAPFPPGTKTVNLGGIDVPMCPAEEPDVSAIPTKAQSDIVLTDTVKRNLETIALNWRSGAFTLLEGPTSSGKTALVRYIANQTKTPYRRINLSADTEVEDLIGRYVGGEERFPKGELMEMSSEQLNAAANELAIDIHSGPATTGFFGGVKEAPLKSKSALIKEILDVQTEAHWVDGPIVQAMKRGELVVLDEINLAKPEVLGRLNELLEARGKLTLKEHEGEPIEPVDGFKVVATMNPATDRGRGRMSAEQYDRWNPVTCHGMTKDDLSEILEVKFGKKLAKEQRDMLVATHEVLSREADRGKIGRRAGGLAFSLRNMEKVAERVIKYGKGSGLDATALIRRETQEVYRDGLTDPEDVVHVDGILDTTMRCKDTDFYSKLKLEKVDGGYQLGDVFIENLGIDDPRVPGSDAELIMTDRAKRIFYQIAKALEMGENVMLIGEKGGGKTCFAEMYALLAGQPFYRQLMTKGTDSKELIGGYGEQGWHDGLVLQAARPDKPPGVLLLDEYLFANTALAERMNSGLDDERQLTLLEKGDGSERVQLHEKAKIIAATNPPTKDYAGRDKFSPATRNRFTVINVPEIDTQDERVEILTGLAGRHGVQPGVAEALCELHEWVNSAYKNPSAPLGKDLPIKKRPDFSMRNLLRAYGTLRTFVRSEGEIDAFLKAVKSTYAARGLPDDCAKIYERAEKMTE